MVKKLIKIIILLSFAVHVKASDTTYIYIDKGYKEFRNVYLFKDTGHYEDNRSRMFGLYEDWGICLIDTARRADFMNTKTMPGRSGKDIISFRISMILYNDIYEEFLHYKYLQQKSADNNSVNADTYKNFFEEAYYKAWYIKSHHFENNFSVIETSRKNTQKIIVGKKTIRLSSVRTKANLANLQSRLNKGIVFIIDENQSTTDSYFIKLVKI